tara:strand:+ start:159 stop:611 length:453 start_codon:yes stop_codon:yes gene_type:complete
LFKSLKFFFQQSEELSNNNEGDLHLLCGLMMEAANVDGQIDQVEINKIHKVLIDVFNEDPLSVEIELQKCLDEIGDNKSLYSFTSKINKSFESEKKMLLLEILWEIILEDGHVHDFESNLVRRLAGLLYISDVQCGNVKRKALEKIKINN